MTKIHYLILTLSFISFSFCIIQVYFNFSNMKNLVWPWALGISSITCLLSIGHLPEKKTIDTVHPYEYLFYLCWNVYYSHIYLALSLMSFSMLSVVVNYITAFVISPFIILFIKIIDQRSLVNYDIDTLDFTLTRCTTYGIIRAISAWLVKSNTVSPEVDRLIPSMIATVETISMFAYNDKSYKFGTRSLLFIVYMITKTAVFLSIPIIEESIINLIKNEE